MEDVTRFQVDSFDSSRVAVESEVFEASNFGEEIGIGRKKSQVVFKWFEFAFDLALVSFEPGDAFEEGGFAGAIFTHDADGFALGDFKVDSFEDFFVAE